MIVSTYTLIPMTLDHRNPMLNSAHRDTSSLQPIILVLDISIKLIKYILALLLTALLLTVIPV
jgi:hypothetical protein